MKSIFLLLSFVVFTQVSLYCQSELICLDIDLNPVIDSGGTRVFYKPAFNERDTEVFFRSGKHIYGPVNNRIRHVAISDSAYFQPRISRELQLEVVQNDQSIKIDFIHAEKCVNLMPNILLYSLNGTRTFIYEELGGAIYKTFGNITLRYPFDKYYVDVDSLEIYPITGLKLGNDTIYPEQSEEPYISPPIIKKGDFYYFLSVIDNTRNVCYVHRNSLNEPKFFIKNIFAYFSVNNGFMFYSDYNKTCFKEYLK